MIFGGCWFGVAIWLTMKEEKKHSNNNDGDKMTF